MFSFHSTCWHAHQCVTRLSQNVGILFAMMTDSGLGIHEYLNQLKQRARRCPFACFLKILVVISFAIALDIAVYFQGAMSFHEYYVFVMLIAYLAILGIITNTNCRLNIPGQK